MVDSRQKGARAESAAKKILIEKTGLNWQRVPGSGSLGVEHMLKADLYVPQTNLIYAVEVKHYKDDHLTSKVLTLKDPQLLQWWEQAVRQGKQMSKEPLLIFKFDRSKFFVMLTIPKPTKVKRFFAFNDFAYICELNDWLDSEEIQWTQ